MKRGWGERLVGTFPDPRFIYFAWYITFFPKIQPAEVFNLIMKTRPPARPSARPFSVRPIARPSVRPDRLQILKIIFKYIKNYSFWECITQNKWNEGGGNVPPDVPPTLVSFILHDTFVNFMQKLDMYHAK